MLLNLKLNVSLVYYFTINVLFLLVSFVFICVIFQTLEEEVTSDEEEGEKKKQEEEQQDGEEEYDEEEFEEVNICRRC